MLEFEGEQLGDLHQCKEEVLGELEELNFEAWGEDKVYYELVSFLHFLLSSVHSEHLIFVLGKVVTI